MEEVGWFVRKWVISSHFNPPPQILACYDGLMTTTLRNYCTSGNAHRRDWNAINSRVSVCLKLQPSLLDPSSSTHLEPGHHQHAASIALQSAAAVVLVSLLSRTCEHCQSHLCRRGNDFAHVICVPWSFMSLPEVIETERESSTVDTARYFRSGKTRNLAWLTWIF